MLELAQALVGTDWSKIVVKKSGDKYKVYRVEVIPASLDESS